ncbi:LysR family transcriptional regulator [Parachitinimonas caeni]|uniref:LysR family transcriptional regulator n=1 Tax=Parachitinimonas caeni TaxID=3031301 RepID=A0ABT7E2A4_9NEIS|nr:LysR family transcriptional regulator [Parachitinimonas caeni]MDK2126439.1 LysR family transcriptional regulator [Parachitinimonas caeni]
MKDYNDLQSLRFFVSIVESGSLSAAARQLDLTTSALSQRLRQLETNLGVRLLDRSTRRIQLTEEGEVLFQRGSVLLKDFEELISDLRERSGQLVGALRIFGPLGFGRRYLAPIVAEFHSMHPDLDISLTLADRFSAHASDRFDLVIHIGELQESNWIVYPIAPNSRVLCAAPQYFQENPPLERPEDLTHHQCLVLRENDEDVTLWQFSQGDDVRRIRVTPSLSANDGEVVKQWALAGKGLIVRSEWDVALNLRSGSLVQALPDWKLQEADVVALAPHRVGMPLRLKTFVTFLQNKFKPTPPWRK